MRFSQFLPFSFFVLLLSGCTQMYVPNMQNVPQFQEKDQVNLTASPQNIQFAWAFSENMGVMANFFSRSIGIDSSNYEEAKTSNTLFEAGTGYYKHTEEGVTFSGFGGIGFGKSDYVFKRPSTQGLGERYKTDLFRFFLQGSIGLIAGNDNVNLAFTTRYANVSFSNIDTTNMTRQELGSRKIQDLEKQNFNFIEPGLTFRAGFKYIKAHTQLVYSSKLEDRPLNYYPINLNIGITLNLKAIYDKITGVEDMEEEQEDSL